MYEDDACSLCKCCVQMNWERFLAIVSFISESVYWHEIGRICNRLLHEFLVCELALTLTIFFCKLKIFPLLEE